MTLRWAPPPPAYSLPSSWTSELSCGITSSLAPTASLARSPSSCFASRSSSISGKGWGAGWKKKTKLRPETHGRLAGEGSFPTGPPHPSPRTPAGSPCGLCPSVPLCSCRFPHLPRLLPQPGPSSSLRTQAFVPAAPPLSYLSLPFQAPLFQVAFPAPPGESGSRAPAAPSRLRMCSGTGPSSRSPLAPSTAQNKAWPEQSSEREIESSGDKSWNDRTDCA